MCGIFGVITSKAADKSRLDRVQQLQRHRGPDGSGAWCTQFGSQVLTFAFQRLAIIDLSAEAMQPFACPDTGSVIVFNGEIYNYIELRAELEGEGYQFRTRSDTEVLLRVLDHWGIEQGLRRLNGMFAFAWFNAKDRSLILARDRAGEKPLYYYRDGSEFIFASEIKTILADLQGRRKFRPNVRSIRRLLGQAIADDSRETFFEEIFQVVPGHFCRVNGGEDALHVSEIQYWDVDLKTERRGVGLPDLIDECRSLLRDSVRMRLRSDVPLGFLLSGGIDSTALIGLALNAGVAPSAIAAFSSIGGDPTTDETHWIDIACRHFGIQSQLSELSPSSQEFGKTLHDAVFAHDEPFTSLSVVAQYLLMKKISTTGRIVILSGQGADELFCGYAKYSAFFVQQCFRDGRPFAAAKAMVQIAQVGTLLPQVSLEELRRYAPWMFPVNSRSILGERLKGLPLEDIGLAGTSLRGRQLLDLKRFSVPMINHYEDRVSMAWSRELRMPYLDPRLIEFALALPDDVKLHGGWTKFILRKAAESDMPKEITWRRDKKGYSLPTHRWLCHDLVPLIRASLGSDALVFRHGYVDYDNFWSSYEAMIKSGSTGHISSKEIIGVLTLESWMRSFERYLDLSPTSIEPGFATCSKAEKETPNVRMRVAQVTSAHLPNDNRIAYHIGATVAEAGYETTIVAPTPAGGMIGVEMPESVKLILLRRRNGRLARFTSLHLEILKIILQQRFEIIHIHDPDLLPLAIALKCAGKRVIYDAHECYRDDLDDKLWIPPFARGAARMAVIAVEWIASKTFDGVISASQDIHDKINPRWGAVVRNFPKMAADGNEALPGSYDERDCIVGYFGSIDELRYGEEMIEALALVRARCPTARMIVAGRIVLHPDIWTQGRG